MKKVPERSYWSFAWWNQEESLACGNKRSLKWLFISLILLCFFCAMYAALIARSVDMRTIAMVTCVAVKVPGSLALLRSLHSKPQALFCWPIFPVFENFTGPFFLFRWWQSLIRLTKDRHITQNYQLLKQYKVTKMYSVKLNSKESNDTNNRKSCTTAPPVICNKVANISCCFRLQSSKSPSANPTLGCFPLVPVQSCTTHDGKKADFPFREDLLPRGFDATLLIYQTQIGLVFLLSFIFLFVATF